MPKQKDLKRIVRSRMQKTGESYTAARLQLTRTQPDYEALSGMRDASVTKATGRGWREWVRLLDKAGAASMPHRDIAVRARELGAGDWWSQAVTVGYERIRGLRAIGQRRGGLWEASRSKTYPVNVATLFDAFARWVGRQKVTVRTKRRPKGMRITWDDGTSVEVYFMPKGEKKSSIAVQHTKLPSKADVAARKAWWGEQLEALAKTLK
ncbi:MAG TPA: hypothetical protein VFT12_02945 [Thermoanaerobaculia bacterium]|nr:hypothetical protein [Thermoanaerobaculia bacterium]